MMVSKAFKVFEDASKAVRPYTKTKQNKTTQRQSRRRAPLLENKTNINSKPKSLVKQATSKGEIKQKTTKDEYLLENLREIFGDEIMKETPHNDFKATSTPSNSQLSNSLLINEKRIKSQKKLDEEINKIHDSINKESIIELFGTLSPQSVSSKERKIYTGMVEAKSKEMIGPTKKSASKKGNIRPLKQIAKIIPHKIASLAIEDKKINSKKRSYNKKCKNTEPPSTQALEFEEHTTKPKSDVGKRCMTRSKVLPEVRRNSEITPKLTCASDVAIQSKAKRKANSEMNLNMKPPAQSKKKKSSSRVHFKRELSYKDLLLKCIKGKDPIDLLL